MTKSEALRWVGEIKELAKTDPEAAHGQEDALFQEVLLAIASESDDGKTDPRGSAVVALESARLTFSRWCA